MPTTVLEFVRDPAGLRVMPQELLSGLEAAFPDVQFLSPPDRGAADRALADADVVFGPAVTAENFGRARRLRWIHVSAAGVTATLFPALIESDVVLTNGRGLWSASMAEHALAMMLAIARKLPHSFEAQRERRWAEIALREEPPAFRALEGATLGLVGYGSIGRALAARARGFGMRIRAVRRRAGTAEDGTAVEGPEGLGALLEASDWVVLAPPLTDATRGMIGAAELARMKPGAVLVNLGRGALVDEAALVRALARRAIGGAALDVTATEPLPESSPLWSLPNVLITPHVSGLGPGIWERATDLFARNLAAFLAGRPLENVVDKRAGY